MIFQNNKRSYHKNQHTSNSSYINFQKYLSLGVHGQRSLAGYSPWGLKESDMTEQLTHTHTHTHTHTSDKNTLFKETIFNSLLLTTHYALIYFTIRSVLNLFHVIPGKKIILDQRNRCIFSSIYYILRVTR